MSSGPCLTQLLQMMPHQQARLTRQAATGVRVVVEATAQNTEGLPRERWAMQLACSHPTGVCGLIDWWVQSAVVLSVVGEKEGAAVCALCFNLSLADSAPKLNELPCGLLRAGGGHSHRALCGRRCSPQQMSLTLVCWCLRPHTRHHHLWPALSLQQRRPWLQQTPARHMAQTRVQSPGSCCLMV